MYQLIKPLLFSIPPELSHELSLCALQWIPRFLFKKPKSNPVETLGLSFSHPIGLAAGFDKNGLYLDALSKLHFSFIEVGTVTPRPQAGNPKPRIFRLPRNHALINHLGFNNEGVEALIRNLEKSHYKGLLGINIGKNKDTSLNDALNDYAFCLQKTYPFASYIAINVSSPNTKDLRQLQTPHYFKNLIESLKTLQLDLADEHGKYVPLLVKLSPDESFETLKTLANTAVTLGIDGLIATNTSVNHREPFGGGISGRPLEGLALNTLRTLKSIVGNDLTLIGVGGIDSAETADARLKAGASLLQIYTGLIYQGPSLVSQLANELSANL